LHNVSVGRFIIIIIIFFQLDLLGFAFGATPWGWRWTAKTCRNGCCIFR